MGNPKLREPSGKSFEDAWAAAERRRRGQQARLRAMQLVNAARACVDELMHQGHRHSPLVSALEAIAGEVGDVGLAWDGQGSVEPSDLVVVLDERAPDLQAAVAEHVGLDDPPPVDRWPEIAPMLGRVWLAVTDTLKDLQTKEIAA